MSKPNKLLTAVNRIYAMKQAPELHSAALSSAFNSQIKYAGTTGIEILEWSPSKAIVNLKNREHVQNHIGGIHATAMATLAESATGMVFGLNVPDTHVPLLKSMKIDFVARSKGDLQAVASLSEEDTNRIQTTDKGSLVVPVIVTDEDGKEPIKCAMEWAWTTLKKPSKPNSKL